MTELSKRSSNEEFDLLRMVGLAAQFFRKYRWVLVGVCLAALVLAFLFAKIFRKYSYSMTISVDSSVYTMTDLQNILPTLPLATPTLGDSIALILHEVSVGTFSLAKDVIPQNAWVTVSVKREVSADTLTGYVVRYVRELPHTVQRFKLEADRLDARLASIDSLRYVMRQNLEGAMQQRKASSVYVEAATADVQFMPLHQLNLERERCVIQRAMLAPFQVLTPFGMPSSNFVELFVRTTIVLVLLGTALILLVDIFSRGIRHLESQRPSAVEED